MAKYRTVRDEFWQDNFILDLTPEEDRFYFYLLTNPFVKQVGIYEIPFRIAETQLKYSKEKILKMIERFENYGKVKYNPQTKEIAIKNWAKHNFATGNILTCINKEVEKVKDKSLLLFVYDDFEYYSEYIPLLSTLQDSSRPLETLQDSSKPSNKEIEIKKEIKKEKEDLLKIEFEEVWKEYPVKKDKIDALENYKKHRKEYSKEQFLTAIKNYKKEIEFKKTEENFIQHGKKFFTKGFIDYINCAAPASETPGNGKKPNGLTTEQIEELEFLKSFEKEELASGN